MYETQCIRRIMKLESNYDEFIDFLKEYRLINDSELADLKISTEENRISTIHSKIREAEDADKIQLVAYDWILLPKERIRITIVTERETKYFSHNW